MKNESAESIVLAGISQLVDAWEEVGDVLGGDCFTMDANQVFYKCVKTHYEREERPFDLPSLLSIGEGYNLSTVINEHITYYRKLFVFPVEKKTVVSEAKKLKKLSLIRGYDIAFAIAKSKVNQLTGEELVSDIIDTAESEISKHTDSILYTDKEELIDIPEKIEAYGEHLKTNKVERLGISTGLHNLDGLIGDGLTSGVHVVVARPKTGKTSFGVSVALNVCEQDVPVMYVDTEMSEEDITDKMLGNMTGLDWIQQIKKGKFVESKNNVAKFDIAVSTIKKFNFTYTQVTSATAHVYAHTFHKIKKWLKTRVGFNEDGTAKKCLLVWDYLKLLSSKEISNNLAEYQALGFLTTQLHDFVKQYKIPCLTFAQANREGWVAAADRISWFCTNLIFFERQTPEEINAQRSRSGIIYNRKITPKFSRTGPGLEEGEGYINARLYKETSKVVEGPFQQQDAENDIQVQL